MGVFSGPDVSELGLVLAFDGGNIKSFKGEDTYNYTRNARDFSGTAYASDDQWTSSEPSVLSKTYISSILTPVGNGATLIQESGSNGFHHLSRWGGGGETGAHSLSCYVFPLTSDITDFVIGMLADGNNQISFNLNTRAITYGPGISNRDAFITPVVGFDGWFRVGANIEGRPGGWVGCIGYTTSSAYTGTSGNKRCYITGIQYEFKTNPTMFVEAQTTRGTTVATGGGWEDLSGNANHGTLINGVKESSDNLGALVFDGTNDYVQSGSFSSQLTADITVEVWIYLAAASSDWVRIIGTGGNTGNRTFGLWYSTSRTLLWQRYGAGDPSIQPGNVLATGTWYYVAATTSGSSHTIYLNGSSVGTATGAGPWSASGENITIGFAGFHTYHNGRISKAKIYNRALTAAEVQQNFNATRSRFGI